MFFSFKNYYNQNFKSANPVHSIQNVLHICVFFLAMSEPRDKKSDLYCPNNNYSVYTLKYIKDYKTQNGKTEEKI